MLVLELKFNNITKIYKFLKKHKCMLKVNIAIPPNNEGVAMLYNTQILFKIEKIKIKIFKKLPKIYFSFDG